MTTLTVRSSGGSYPVIIESAALSRFREVAPIPASVERVALIADANTHALFAPWLAAALSLDQREVVHFTLTPGEPAKSTDTLASLWSFLASSQIHRGDLVIALGGGVVTDVAGFAAASYHRGIAWIAVPTTLLGMVDASIGGKTAIDLPEGKNLAGAFHAPLAVIVDPSTLATLSERELRTGLAEVIKHGLIAPGDLLDRVLADRDAILGRDATTLERVVTDAARVKVNVVSRDETERGERAHLNYGHTFAHALETIEGYAGHSHGEAVSIGLVFAARLAARLGKPDLVALHVDALTAIGLPTDPPDVDIDVSIATMWRDKKVDRGLRCVLLEDLGKPTVVTVDEADVRATLEAWT